MLATRGAAAALFAVWITTQPQIPPRFDLVIVGGRIVDGTGAPARRADVGIKDGKVAAIGTFSKQNGRDAVDATGLVVAPGFIDVHTHADDIT